MKNRRKGMIMVSMWVFPEDKKEIDHILKKPVKSEVDIALIGDIVGSAHARGDFNK